MEADRLERDVDVLAVTVATLPFGAGAHDFARNRLGSGRPASRVKTIEPLSS